MQKTINMKTVLTIPDLISCAHEFCEAENGVLREELYGVTDGKAVGTLVEHLFKIHLTERYDLTIGNSANGLDLPSVNTDIKVTSIKQPQSSCPYKDSRTADYQTTTGLLNIINNNGNVDDIFAFLSDHKIPADEVTLNNMASDILKNPPAIGYLTISNALQWRLQYNRIVFLDEDINGITPIVKYDGK